MLRTTKNMKEKYEKIQSLLFSLIPEKWDSIYLFASVGVPIYGQINETMQNDSGENEKGEMFFYYLPKGLLKKRPVNVYEVPQRFNISEEQYLKIVEDLYKCVKSLKQDFIETEQDIWTNLTISIANFKFKIEYRYDELPKTEREIYERNIIWRYKYLKIGGETREEHRILDNYYTNLKPIKKETYETGIYIKTDNNKVTFDKDMEFVIYEKDDIADLAKKKNKISKSNKEMNNINIEVKKENAVQDNCSTIKNQILNN